MKHLLIAAVAALVSASALADGPSAARNLLRNLAAGKQDIGLSESNAQVAPTLIRGMYALSTTRGQFVGYTNESGTVFGDSRGFNGKPPGAKAFRALTPDETADLRREMMRNIDLGKLIATRYGHGENRVFLFSAIDCPACSRLEAQLRENPNENVTFFIVPSSLQPSRDSRQWQKVSNIWCAHDREGAWKAYWSSGATTPAPATSKCPLSDPRVASQASGYLWNMLEGAGIRLHGTPAIVSEDGVKITAAMLDHKPQPGAGKPDYWLTGDRYADDFRPQPVRR